jgi:hypothetical protein
MGIAYRADDDLALLQYCDEEDLRQLAQFIIHDKNGNERIASQIKSDPSFKSIAHWLFRKSAAALSSKWPYSFV